MASSKFNVSAEAKIINDVLPRYRDLITWEWDIRIRYQGNDIPVEEGTTDEDPQM